MVSSLFPTEELFLKLYLPFFACFSQAFGYLLFLKIVSSLLFRYSIFKEPLSPL